MCGCVDESFGKDEGMGRGKFPQFWRLFGVWVGVESEHAMFFAERRYTDDVTGIRENMKG